MAALIRRLAAVAIACFLALPAHGAGICGGRDLLAGTEGQTLAARVAPYAERIHADATFWRVTSPDPAVKPSYLLGTIHLTDERVTTLPSAVAAALDGARVLALESRAALQTQQSPEAMQDFLRLAVYMDGRSLKSVLSEDEVQALLRALAARELPGWMFLAWKPWAVVVSALTYPPCEMKRLVGGVKFLDAALLARAEAAGKPIADLEDFAEQLGTVAAVPEAVQVALLQGSLKLEPMSVDLHETMVQLYLVGRIGTLIGLSKALLAEVAPTADFTPFWTELLDTRNARMVERATTLAREGNAFIAAGAGHLIGETGLVAGLRRAGFAVEPMR